ncbi:unnamed protein product [Rotaria socialis]|uniref:Uncharacterized protein n=1 Tax=Rotaria socialis TaxID=392032 RepID=A0A817TPD0_9BILA|nr:unnamed protein product [Rotaria socialis]CAF3317477.1 unnamed protein product [Rotaria socialis]CAF3425157.1 unnamed protein product [Rotaria socialis]CAF3505074.1 unnamed protein product [Rotaria socialis]CAF3788636.1 unnamed protein product [Rotaria socialis]
MGLKLSSLCSKNKTKKQGKKHSTKTKTYNVRNNEKSLNASTPLIRNEESQDLLTTSDRVLNEPIHMHSELDEEPYQLSSSFDSYSNQYENGTVAVISREPMKQCLIIRI